MAPIVGWSAEGFGTTTSRAAQQSLAYLTPYPTPARGAHFVNRESRTPAAVWGHARRFSSTRSTAKKRVGSHPPDELFQACQWPLSA